MGRYDMTKATPCVLRINRARLGRVDQRLVPVVSGEKVACGLRSESKLNGLFHCSLAQRIAARALVAALACIIAAPAGAQSPETLDLTAVGKDPRWKVVGRTTSIVD